MPDGEDQPQDIHEQGGNYGAGHLSAPFTVVFTPDQWPFSLFWPVNITDKQLGRLNEVGIAQNYNMTGESSTHHSSGRVK